MGQGEIDILSLLERCITCNDSDAFERLWNIYLHYIRGIIRKTGLQPKQKPEFIDWFKGWIWVPGSRTAKARIESSYLALKKKVDAGECKMSDEQARYFRHYLGKIVRTGVVEYLRELMPHARKTTRLPVKTAIDIMAVTCIAETLPSASGADRQDEVSTRKQESAVFPGSLAPSGASWGWPRTALPEIDEIASELPSPDWELERTEERRMIERALSKMSLKNSVTLILKSKPLFSFIGLSMDRWQWLSEQSGLSVDECMRAVYKEFRAHSENEYPLSAKFIGGLLGIEPNTVDSRARHGWKSLSAFVKAGEAGDA